MFIKTYVLFIYQLFHVFMIILYYLCHRCVFLDHLRFQFELRDVHLVGNILELYHIRFNGSKKTIVVCDKLAIFHQFLDDNRYGEYAIYKYCNRNAVLSTFIIDH